jgi:ABC-type multidrug transport system fused ATPase/permease subunit
VNTARRIAGWLTPYRSQTAWAVALTGLACLLNLPIPLLVQRLVDGALDGGSPWNLIACSLGLLAVFAAQGAAGLANGLIIGRVGQSIVRDLRHGLYSRLQRLGLEYYDRTPTGAIISRLMDDVGAIQAFLTGQSVTILTDLGTAVAVSALLAARGGKLAAVTMAFVVLHTLGFPYFLRRIRAINAVIRTKMDALFGHLKEKIDGSLLIRVHAQEAAEEREFAGRLADVHVPRVDEARHLAALSSVSAMIGGLGVAAVFAVGAWETLDGRMTPGTVVSTVALAALLFGPIARLADLAYLFEQASASVDRLGEIHDLKPAGIEPAAPIVIGRARGLVEFDRVGFGYRHGSPVIWDVRLRVEPGMKVALVGPTGCGKSTLVNLLLRFYDPSSGEIRLDGTPIRQISTADLRRQIGSVLQDPAIFRQSIADNIRYGNPSASDAQVEAAARAALVHGFASALPDGYATIIGEGGYKLSQGECQRLTIARAFCMDPALIVLDEATSSLDPAAEAIIQAALANLLRGRTALIIAHRLSTIMDSDLIVVMDGGLIVQQGTHEELLAAEEGLYRQLYLRQFGTSGPAAVSRQGPPTAIPAPHLGSTAAARHRASAR